MKKWLKQLDLTNGQYDNQNGKMVKVKTLNSYKLLGVTLAFMIKQTENV
jgi:hypothetical protein